MKQKTNKYFSSIFNLAIYFSSGVAAPFFFKNIPDRHRAGMYAGALFIITALRALRLALTRPYLLWVRQFFIALFFIEFSFWVWRMTNSMPLNDLVVFGSVTGEMLHHFMTMLYAVSCGVVIFSEVRWLRKS